MKRLAIALTVVAASVSLTGCFKAEEEGEVRLGETEGIYVNAGGLKYQVQISRILNPNLPEDRAYLGGIEDPLERQLTDEEEWFGVFLRVENDEEEPARSVAEVKIKDTTGAEFEPVEQSAEENPIVYEPTVLEEGQVYPDPNSIARAGPTQGAVILFKIPRQNLENRPLELEIEPPGAEPALVDLDV
jgi:hypothetical protein